VKKVLDRFHAIDLSHPLHEKVPTWSGGCGFRLEVKLDYPQGLRVQSLKSHAGVGTHIDAPTHFIEGSWNIGDIPLENLIVPVCVLDVRDQMAPDLFISEEDVGKFEERYGQVAKGSLFLANTGWSKFWEDPLKYRNPDSEGRMHFPGFSEGAAKLLVSRGVVGVGIDTMSPDGSINGGGARYPVHEVVLGGRGYIIENLVNLERMPAVGAFAIALPPRVREATECAARVVGLVCETVPHQ